MADAGKQVRIGAGKPPAHGSQVSGGQDTVAAAGLVALCVVAIPLLSIQLGHVGDGADPTSYTDKRAYDLISEGFGPGYNGPFTIVVDVGHGASGDTKLALALQSDLAATKGVGKATPLSPTPSGVLPTRYSSIDAGLVTFRCSALARPDLCDLRVHSRGCLTSGWRSVLLAGSAAPCRA
jgi:hypothetical protein